MEKLYLTDVHRTEFEATVTDCIYHAQEERYEIILDRTAFFPEEGGQLADKGLLGGQKVLDVQIQKDIISHYVKEAIAPGTSVCGQVDWAQRFDFMQQHSGEHMISGLVNKHFGLDNVGFHLGLSEVTLDFNGELTLGQLRSIEAEANAAIWQNLPIFISYPDSTKLAELSYRSKLDLTENVRIVTIPGIDTCACCAPHCDTTGQIGLVKITNVQNHRGGVRVNILCGGRAVADYTEKQNSVSSISVLLSASQTSVTDAVTRLKEENQKAKDLRNSLQIKLLDTYVAKLPSPECSKHAVLFMDEMNEVAVRNVINDLINRYDGYCAAFAGNDTDGYRFIIGSSSRDCRELATLMRQSFDAKGGGTAPMIQGTVHTTMNALRSLF